MRTSRGVAEPTADVNLRERGAPSRAQLVIWIRPIAVGFAISMCVVLGVDGPQAAAASHVAPGGVSASVKSDPAGRARGVAARAARSFLSRSGCPLRLSSVALGARVTSANRSKAINRILEKTLVTTGPAGACTDIEGPVGARANAAYRSAVRSQTTLGDFLVTFSWRDATGRVRQTAGVVRPGHNPRLKFEPLMATFRQPPPAQTPSGPISRSTSVLARAGAGTGEHSWQPWGLNGRCLASNIFGRCAVRKFVSMAIFTDEQDNIVGQAEGVVVGGSPFFKSERRILVETVDSPTRRCRCRKLTIQTYTVNIFGTITSSPGTGGFDVDLGATGGSPSVDVEVYTLCADGTSDLVD